MFPTPPLPPLHCTQFPPPEASFHKLLYYLYLCWYQLAGGMPSTCYPFPPGPDTFDSVAGTVGAEVGHKQ